MLCSNFIKNVIITDLLTSVKWKRKSCVEMARGSGNQIKFLLMLSSHSNNVIFVIILETAYIIHGKREGFKFGRHLYKIYGFAFSVKCIRERDINCNIKFSVPLR